MPLNMRRTLSYHMAHHNAPRDTNLIQPRGVRIRP
jgi:hypothetical protein